MRQKSYDILEEFDQNTVLELFANKPIKCISCLNFLKGCKHFDVCQECWLDSESDIIRLLVDREDSRADLVANPKFRRNLKDIIGHLLMWDDARELVLKGHDYGAFIVLQ